MIDLEQIWKKTLAQIEVKLDSRKHFVTWFSYTRLISIDKTVAIIGTHNSFNADFLMKRHKSLITDTLSFVYGTRLKIKIEFDEKSAVLAQESRKKEREDSVTPLLEMSELGATKEISYLLKQGRINPKYTFSTFIVGSSNRLAHAAAKSIAENPTSSVNPLFLHGATGLGKTHLAQAVARELIDKNSATKVLYTTSENFLNDLVMAIKTNQTQKFRTKYRELDLLIIDDIQMISSWVETQSEFFNTFNALHQEGKKVILISDRPPEEIQKLEDRLKSRFQGGLVVDIKEPDYETRIAILDQKRKLLNINLPSSNIRDIAQIVTTNVRELEGSLQKVSLYASLAKDHELSFDEIANILGKKSDKKRTLIKVSDVLKRVGDEFSIKTSEIKGDRRTKETALARQVCMYILREEMRYKLENVAHTLNRKDHTTIMHGIEKIKEKILREPSFKLQLEKIIKDLQA